MGRLCSRRFWLSRLFHIERSWHTCRFTVVFVSGRQDLPSDARAYSFKAFYYGRVRALIFSKLTQGKEPVQIQLRLIVLSKIDKCVRFLAPRSLRIVKFLKHDWFVRKTTNTKGKECGSILSSRLWGGALRDDTKNGCVAD